MSSAPPSSSCRGRAREPGRVGVGLGGKRVPYEPTGTSLRVLYAVPESPRVSHTRRLPRLPAPGTIPTVSRTQTGELCFYRGEDS